MLGVIQNSAFPQPLTPELRGVVYETEKSSLLGDVYFTAHYFLALAINPHSGYKVYKV